MQTATLVSVSEYLHADYEPDVDYVDGLVYDRNVGEKDHAKLQGRLHAYLLARSAELGIYPYVELRIKVTETRYRIPDVCAFTGEDPDEQVPSRPPFLVVEVLSPDDRVTRVERKLRDFLEMGVAFIWVIDPQTNTGWIHTSDRAVQIRDGVFTAGRISINLSQLS